MEVEKPSIGMFVIEVQFAAKVVRDIDNGYDIDFIPVRVVMMQF